MVDLEQRIAVAGIERYLREHQRSPAAAHLAALRALQREADARRLTRPQRAPLLLGATASLLRGASSLLERLASALDGATRREELEPAVW